MDDDVDDPVHPGPPAKIDYGTHVPVPDAQLELTAEEKEACRMASGGPPRIEVGDDGRARLEKDLGLDIDPKTGRAFESQGSFQNLGLGAGGRFYDGRAVPRIAKCEACEAVIHEAAWAMGFQNCGALDLGLGGAFFLCPECILKILRLFPRLRALVAAANGGARG